MVLHRSDYSNTSLLLEILSRGHGRFPVIARGAKRRKSPSAGLLQPFRPLLVSVSGRGEVKTLIQVEADGPAPVLTGRPLYCGFYLNELIMRLLARNDPHESLYDHYRAALNGLADGLAENLLLRRFEVRLLEQTGYAMILDRDVESGLPIDGAGRYRYVPDRGPLACLNGDPGFHVAGDTLLDLAAGRAAGREARELMRRVLATHLGDRPLKSRELFRNLFGNKG